MTKVIDTIKAAAARGAAVRPTVGGFPYLAEAFRAAGVTSYHFDVASSTLIFVTDEGVVLQPGQLIRTDPTVIPPFDEAQLVAAIRADQRGKSTFGEFVEASFMAGVVRFVVDTAERTCTYLGARGERYVEECRAVELPPHPTSRS